jgi:hypothetical protein
MSGARSPPPEAGRGRHANTARNPTIGRQHSQRVRPTSMPGIYLIDSLGFLRIIDRPGVSCQARPMARSDAEEVGAGC